MVKDLVDLLKKIDVVYWEPVKLKNLDVSEYYVDVKKACGYPEALKLIANHLLEIVPRETTCIAAAGYGGLPIAVALVMSASNNLKLALIRDQPKGHGRRELIDGYIPTKEDKVAVVDDVLTTGGSIREIIETLGPTQADILGCYVVVKRGQCELSASIYHLMTAEDLL